MTSKAIALVLALALAAPASAQECIPRGSAVVAPVQASATGTTGAVSASLPASTTGKYTFLCGFSVTSGGATTASTRAVTLVGTGTTMNYSYVDPVGSQGNLSPLFPICLISAAPNTALTLNVPGTGTGTVALAVTMWGCYQ